MFATRASSIARTVGTAAFRNYKVAVVGASGGIGKIFKIFILG
jgi:hypothetical protein